MENLHRQDLNPLEEAAAFRQLLEDFEVTHAELGERLGKGRATISNSIRLLELPTDAQEAIAEGKITAGHARSLLACTPGPQQDQLLRKILTGASQCGNQKHSPKRRPLKPLPQLGPGCRTRCPRRQFWKHKTS